MRKGRGAIGAYGREGGGPRAEKEKLKARLDSEEEEESVFQEKLHQWKKGGDKKRVKYVYKTADQVLEDGKWRKISRESTSGSMGSKVKVIDMTGKEERVLSGYHAIGAAKQRPDEDYDQEGAKEKPNFAIPELLHNINMIMDKCEEELVRPFFLFFFRSVNVKNGPNVELPLQISADRKLIYHRDRVEVLKVEEEKLSKLVDREKGQIETLEGVLAMVEKVEALHEDKKLDMESATEMFRQMHAKYPGVSVSCALSIGLLLCSTGFSSHSLSRSIAYTNCLI